VPEIPKVNYQAERMFEIKYKISFKAYKNKKQINQLVRPV